MPIPPHRPQGGRPRISDRACLTGIVFVLRSGIPWQMLPQELGCGSGMTCWRRLRDWQQVGVWDLIHFALLAWPARNDQIDWSRAVVERTFAWLNRFRRLRVRYDKRVDIHEAFLSFWKPDSREIAFFAAGKLKTVPLTGGAPVNVCDVEMGNDVEGGGAWSRGDVIVFRSRPGVLQQVPAKGGAVPVPVTALEKGDVAHRWPSFLPDGQHFLYLAHLPNGQELRVASLDGKPAMTLGRFESNAMYASGHPLFVRGDQLVAQPFDLSSHQVRGDPFPLASMSKVSFSRDRNWPRCWRVVRVAGSQKMERKLLFVSPPTSIESVGFDTASTM